LIANKREKPRTISIKFQKKYYNDDDAKKLLSQVRKCHVPFSIVVEQDESKSCHKPEDHAY
jgi:hypothetical protein